MKKIYFYIILFLISLSVVKAENIPSAGLAEVAKTSPENFLGLDASTDKRLNLFTSSWVRANKGTPVDNRAYLFALAIDLYNSIPPDLKYKPRKLAPGEDVYTPNLWPIKQQLYFNKISTIDGNKPVREKTTEEKKKGLERFKKRLFKRFKENSPEANARLKADLEYTYLRQHIREQVALGNIHIDAQTAPASMRPDELDIYHPKHYAELREYMKTVQPLIDTLTPPWEAEKQDAVAKTKDHPTPTDVEQPSQAVTPSAERSTDTPPSEKTDLSRYLVILALLTLGLAVLVYVLRRRGKK